MEAGFLRRTSTAGMAPVRVLDEEGIVALDAEAGGVVEIGHPRGEADG